MELDLRPTGSAVATARSSVQTCTHCSGLHTLRSRGSRGSRTLSVADPVIASSVPRLCLAQLVLGLEQTTLNIEGDAMTDWGK